MVMWTPGTFRNVVVTVTMCLLMIGGWSADAKAQRLGEGTLFCPAGSQSGDTLSQNLLNALIGPLNDQWPSLASDNIDPYPSGQNPPVNTSVPVSCSLNGGDQFCGEKFGSCVEQHVNIQVQQVTGLKRMRFSNWSLTAINQKDVAAHSNAGPDGGKITDGVFASDGHSSTDPAYAIVLPHSANDPRGAVVIDLGSVHSICGNSTDCFSGPIIQADNDDVYQLEYSSDGVNWKKYGQFSTVSGSGLRTRGVATITSGVRNPSFSARYVRVYAVSGGSTFAVSELKLWNTGSQIISVGKPAIGPRPYVISDGKFAGDGHSATDTGSAVLLTHLPGPARALVIDLGTVMQICGNGYQCLSEPVIEADNDDVYQFDYSSDGKNWTTYPGKFSTVSGSGLRKRNMQCSARPDPTTPCSSTNHGPNFTARYIRVYAVSGGDTFAVSELQLWNTGSKLISAGAATYGPEPFVTNGDRAPEGTAFNDNRYANVLPVCSTPNSVCPAPSALTAAALIDLQEIFPISQLQIQADRHQFQVDVSADGVVWSPLWTVPSVSGSGLRTRTSPQFTGVSGRFLRVYGTAGDDNNYSISALEVYTPQANTACVYDPEANAGKNFACSYDGQFSPGLVLPDNSNTELVVNFHLNSAQLRTTCAILGFGNVTDSRVPSASNLDCTASLKLDPTTPTNTGEFCAGSCASGSPGSVLSYAQLSDLKFTTTSLTCKTLDSELVSAVKTGISDIVSPPTLDLLNAALDYRNKLVVPSPSDPGMCSGLVSVPPPEPPSDTASGMSGQAVQVGSANGNGSLRIIGRFTASEPIDLSRIGITLEALLNEIGGAGELVRGAAGTLLVPVSLDPRPGSKPDKGIYGTAPSVSPKVDAQITPVKDRGAESGLMEYVINVHQAKIAAPPACVSSSAGTAPLTTSFHLIGSSGPPILVRDTADWQCSGNQLQTPVASKGKGSGKSR